MKKSILKSSIALAVAGVFGATVAVTAAEQAAPAPVAQEVAVTAAPVAQPVADQAVPKIEVASVARAEVAPVVTTAVVTPVQPAQDTTPVPTATQDIKTPVAQETVVPAAANPAAAVPTIETAAVAKAPSETKVVRVGDKKTEPSAKAEKTVKNNKKAHADKAPKAKAVKEEKKADKKETTKEEKNSKSRKSQPSTTSQPAGVVDQNSIFVIGANYLIDQFETKFGDSKITNVSFKAADKTAIYEVAGFNANGAHSLTLDVATGNVTEGTPKAYDASMEASAIDAGTVLPPHVAINAAFAQTGNIATGINSWSVTNQNGTPVYNVEFHDAQNKPVSIVLDAKTGMAVK